MLAIPASCHPPPTFPWLPGNQTWRSSVVCLFALLRSHTAGLKGGRCSSRASAWNACSILSDRFVS